MLTEKFAPTGTDVFLTGVAYDDTDGDAFYSVGEAVAGLSFGAGGSIGPERCGGGLPTGPCPGRGHGGPRSRVAGSTRWSPIDTSGGNVKLDVVDGTWVLASADMTLVSGIAAARLLGVGDLDLTGSDGRTIG
jgi:serralysin